MPYSKEQQREYHKEYYERNKERIKERVREYYADNIEKIKKTKKKYRTKQLAGVYLIRNTKNNTCYIGQSTDYNSRWRHHRHHLRSNKHKNPDLQADYNEYGEEAFTYELIEEFPHDTASDILMIKEGEYIENFKNEGRKLYNIGYEWKRRRTT